MRNERITNRKREPKTKGRLNWGYLLTIKCAIASRLPSLYPKSEEPGSQLECANVEIINREKPQNEECRIKWRGSLKLR